MEDDQQGRVDQLSEVRRDKILDLIKEQGSVLEKQKIGRRAAELLENNQSVIFDSSSTVGQAVNLVLLKGISFRAATNDIEIASRFADSDNVELCVLGGTLGSRFPCPAPCGYLPR